MSETTATLKRVSAVVLFVFLRSNCSILKGTVVDKGVTGVYTFDFFLQSVRYIYYTYSELLIIEPVLYSMVCCIPS